jgi:hypothetical protein
MRENRPYGSEGGEGDTFPTPIEPGAGLVVHKAGHDDGESPDQ